MTFTANELLNETDPHWFCLKTKPKHEAVAAFTLGRQIGLECVSPRIRFRKNTRRGPVWFVEALFPCYIFAKFVYVDVHRHVQSINGVTSIVHFGSRVASISEQTIADLREAGGKEQMLVFNPEPKVGDEVKIAEGAFRGLEAVVTQVLPQRERVKVLLEFLGRSVEAEIRAPHVIPDISPRAASLGA